MYEWNPEGQGEKAAGVQVGPAEPQACGTAVGGEDLSLSLSLLNCLPVSLTTRDGTLAPAVEEQGLSHWATRKSSIKGGTRRRGWRRGRVTPVWA